MLFIHKIFIIQENIMIFQFIMPIYSSYIKIIMKKFTNEIDYLIKNQDIVQLKIKWSDKEYDVIEFTNELLNIINISEQQNVAVTIGLVQIFKTITFHKKLTKIKFKDFNQYLMHRTYPMVNFGIHQKCLPLYIKQQAREFAQPPIILGKKHIDNLRITDYLICHDTKNHNKKLIKKLEISQSRKYLFCLFQRSTQIIVYNDEFKEDFKISSKNQSNIILNIKWCEKQKTLAALFRDSISFWPNKQNFSFEYKIILVDPLIHFDYVENLNLWIGVKKQNGRIVYIDIVKKQKVDELISQKFQQEYRKKTHENVDLFENNRFEIEHKKKKALKCIQIKFASIYGIAISTSLYFFNFKKKLLASSIENFSNKIRSITYSDEYQLLFLTNFDRTVLIYQLNPRYCDFQKKDSKIISRNIFVSITYQPKSPNLITFDEASYFKLWNFVDMICYQSVALGAQFSITSILCIQDKLIIGGSRVAYYQFINAQKVVNDAINTIVSSNDNIYISIKNSIKSINLLSGKNQKILQGIFQDQQQITKMIVNESDDLLLALGSSGTIRFINMSTGELLNTTKISNHINALILDINTNNYYISTKTKLTVCNTRQGSLNIFKVIENMKPKLMGYNYFNRLISVLEDEFLYIIQQQSFQITHMIKIENQSNLIGIEFIEGSEYILCVYRKQIIILRLGKQGNLTEKLKADINFHKDNLQQQITCFKFDKQINDETNLIRNLNIYVGSNKGTLYEFRLRNVNFVIIKSKILKQQKLELPKNKKLVSHMFDILKLNFSEQIVYTQKFEFTYLITEILKKQTKLQFVKNIQLRVNDNLKLLIICNINIILVFSKKCQPLGQININQIYPIYWNINDQLKIQKQEDYAKKVLSYLGKSEQYPIKLKKKDYIVNDLFKDSRDTINNGLIKKNLYKLKQAPSDIKEEVSKIMSNKGERLQKIRQLKKNILKNQQINQNDFGIDKQLLQNINYLRFSNKNIKLKQEQQTIQQYYNQKLKTQTDHQFINKERRSSQKRIKTESRYSPIKLTKSHSKYQQSKSKKYLNDQIPKQLIKSINSKKNKYVSFGSKIISASTLNLPKILSNKLQTKI